jgi:hypothetical protein
MDEAGENDGNVGTRLMEVTNCRGKDLEPLFSQFPCRPFLFLISS